MCYSVYVAETSLKKRLRIEKNGVPLKEMSAATYRLKYKLTSLQLLTLLALSQCYLSALPVLKFNGYANNERK